MPPPMIAIRFMRSLRDLLSFDAAPAIRTQRSQATARQIGDRPHKERRIIQRFGPVELHSTLFRKLPEQDVDIKKNFDMIADEADRLDEHPCVTVRRVAS